MGFLGLQGRAPTGGPAPEHGAGALTLGALSSAWQITFLRAEVVDDFWIGARRWPVPRKALLMQCCSCVHASLLGCWRDRLAQKHDM